ncbi:MAG TPA: ribonuclease J [Hyphomicrobiaceae bacterium]|nr:ribonuclease J [Hyphomicrobiaceae bacterium]
MTEQSPTAPGPSPGDELVFLALGGIGEIGMNCYLYGLGPADARQWLMVDLGITFPEGENDPGIDVILPDLRFIEAERTSLAGIVLTHAHEDHFGAVAELWWRLRAPIYATPFAAALLAAKLAEFGGRERPEVRVVALDSRFTVGRFDIELISLAHSIPESNALLLRTPLGSVLHTGDWKLDATPLIGAPADVARLVRLGDDGVRAMVCDSTNALREGRSPSERDVARTLSGLIRTAKGRVAVTIFASNVARIRAVADAARSAGRQLVVAGRAMHRIIAAAMDTGYLPSDFKYRDQEHYQYLERDETVLLCTGSQGEPRAAMARIAEDQHPHISLGKGDLVIFSSRTIPGNERAVGRIHNQLVDLGCELLTDADALVHVTGHPRREELKEMYGWVRPRVAIPMHGEARHLAEHAKLARAAGVNEVVAVRNGDVVRLGPGAAEVIDQAPVGRLYRDGRLLLAAEDGPLRQRRALAFAGIVIVSLTLSLRGELLADPLIMLDGVPALDGRGESMLEHLLDVVDDTLKSIPAARRKDGETVREAVRRAVRARVEDLWGKRPITKVLLTQLNARG